MVTGAQLAELPYDAPGRRSGKRVSADARLELDAVAGLRAQPGR